VPAFTKGTWLIDESECNQSARRAGAVAGCRHPCVAGWPLPIKSHFSGCSENGRKHGLIRTLNMLKMCRKFPPAAKPSHSRAAIRAVELRLV
jgi:hypothetical protein